MHIACLILTMSRTVFLVTVVAIGLYIFINKSRKKTIYTLYSLLINGIFSIMYVILWNKVEFIWLITLVILLISPLSIIIIDKSYNFIEKISKKPYIIALISITVITLLLIVIGLKLITPLKVFSSEDSSGYVKYNIPNIKPNTEYTLKFNINAKSTAENLNNYKITIDEEDKYCEKITSHEIEFNNFNGTKEFNFITTDETNEFAIYIESKYKIAQLGLTINSLYVNDEEYALNYLYLPVSLVYRLKDINFKDKSVWERGTFYYDALKIIKTNFLFGFGGNAWNYKYKEVQSYNYSSKEVHSFFFQIFLENGIIGALALCIIIYYIIKTFIKYNKNNLAIFIVTFLIVFHSLVDFDMSFYYIMIMTFTFLGVISSNKNEKIA